MAWWSPAAAAGMTVVQQHAPTSWLPSTAFLARGFGSALIKLRKPTFALEL